MSNIKFKAKKLVNKEWLIAYSTLKKQKMTHFITKRFLKINEIIEQEQTEFIKEGISIREEIFGKDVSNELLTVMVAMGTENEQKVLSEYFSSSRVFSPGSDRKEFLEKFATLKKRSDDIGETEIELSFPKLLFPDSFEFPFEMSIILSDIIDLTEGT